MQEQTTEFRALIYWGEDRHEEFATGSPQAIADKARAKLGNVTRDGRPLARTIGNACLSIARGDARYAEIQMPGGHEPVLEISQAGEPSTQGSEAL